MNRTTVLAAALLAAALAGGCDYARMTNDEAVQTYEAPLPTMPADTVPIGGGIEAVKRLPPGALHSPLPASPATVELGRVAYGNYCVHCHGPRADGNGTVGQSFAPLPTDLRSDPVQRQSDGELFATISLGFRRHPSLSDTVSETDRWAVVAYLRALPSRRPSR